MKIITLNLIYSHTHWGKKIDSMSSAACENNGFLLTRFLGALSAYLWAVRVSLCCPRNSLQWVSSADVTKLSITGTVCPVSILDAVWEEVKNSEAEPVPFRNITDYFFF